MKKIKIVLIIGVSLLVISVAFLLYPTIANLVNSIFNSSTISNYSENANTLSEQAVNDEFRAASEYNKEISERVSVSYATKASISGYDDILNFDGVIGYITIPEIDVNLPIYHGSDENVLTKGAAHLPNTSFPIGGVGNHAVLSAHTGYPNQVFFDDLPKLKSGDLIYVSVLNRQMTYTVDEINIVEPDDIRLLQIDDDRDLISLVTCYPYGINSHRLIVTAERAVVEAPNNKLPDVESDNYSFIVVIFTVLLLLASLIFTVIKVRKGREDNA